MRSNVMIKPLSDKLLPFSLGVDWDRELSDTDFLRLDVLE